VSVALVGCALCGMGLSVNQAQARMRAPNSTPAGRCQNLVRQFDEAWPSHQTRADAELIVQWRNQGQGACQAGRYHEGIHDLKRALLRLGIKPVQPIKKIS